MILVTVCDFAKYLHDQQDELAFKVDFTENQTRK